jgi:hypothetical protein
MAHLSGNELDQFASEANANGKCGRCKFWEPYHVPRWGEDVFGVKRVEYGGFCKRRSPGMSEIDPNEPQWPHTGWNEWCGDHEPARESFFHEASVDQGSG